LKTPYTHSIKENLGDPYSHSPWLTQNTRMFLNWALEIYLET